MVLGWGESRWISSRESLESGGECCTHIRGGWKRSGVCQYCMMSHIDNSITSRRRIRKVCMQSCMASGLKNVL